MDASTALAAGTWRNASPADTEQLRVIATTEDGTRAALLEAGRLATHFGRQQVTVLVPHIAAPLGSLDSPGADTDMVERYRRIARRTGVDATVSLCICGALREMFRWMLPRGCVVIVGGRRRWWWPTREQRIADVLTSAGHRIVFADASTVSAGDG
jgi:hypothetical protein